MREAKFIVFHNFIPYKILLLVPFIDLLYFFPLPFLFLVSDDENSNIRMKGSERVVVVLEEENGLEIFSDQVSKTCKSSIKAIKTMN